MNPPDGWLARLGLLALAAGLLSFSFAPWNQFYLAWIGLVPWLIAVAPARSAVRAFAWGWLGGVCFFSANVMWLWRATVPGTIALVCYLALFWGFVAAMMHLTGVLRAGRRPSAGILSVFTVAAIWVGSEWLRATLLSGFPWILLGQSQSPLLVMCQIADVTGVFGVAFWIVSINALITMLFLRRWNRDQSSIAIASVLLLIVAVAVYGGFRLRQQTTTPGPRVMVVQPNHAHKRGGEKTVTQEEQIEYHLTATECALAGDADVDLVVWSETVMPPLNREARHELRNESSGTFLAGIDRRLQEFARRNRTALVTGAYSVGGWQTIDNKRTATDIRNSVFLYHADGTQSPLQYDKIHLVPFGEFLPFRRSAPAVYRLLSWFAAYSVEYAITPAPREAMTVFEIHPMRHSDEWTSPARFVTPICFEDVDAALLARMFRPGDDGRKRADFIVNITNDGWFRGNQQAQHLQAAIFRSIENRVPTARADNTGISGFIDSAGRTSRDSLLPVRTDGTLTRRVMLDRRIPIYTRIGDVFAISCLGAVAVLSLGPLARGLRAQPDFPPQRR